LADYDYEIAYKVGKFNANIDALSRNPVPNHAFPLSTSQIEPSKIDYNQEALYDDEHNIDKGSYQENFDDEILSSEEQSDDNETANDSDNDHEITRELTNKSDLVRNEECGESM